MLTRGADVSCDLQRDIDTFSVTRYYLAIISVEIVKQARCDENRFARIVLKSYNYKY